MKRYKAALKAALLPAIVGFIGIVVGIILFIVGSTTTNETYQIVGLIVFFGSVFVGGMMTVSQIKQTLNAICPECEKFMGDTKDVVNYSFECNEYKPNVKRDTGELIDYTFYYTCTIVCPHCGASHMFEYKTKAKTASKANAAVNDYMKQTLKIKN